MVTRRCFYCRKMRAEHEFPRQARREHSKCVECSSPDESLSEKVSDAVESLCIRAFPAADFKSRWAFRAFRAARARATAASVPFSVTVADIMAVSPDVCPALGHPLVYQVTAGGPDPYTASLDRFYPDEGYVPGNVYVISIRANVIKTDATAEEVARVADWMWNQL